MTRIKQIRLTDSQLAAKVDQETGEVIILKDYANNIPSGKSIFNNGFFRKPSVYGLEWMDKELSDIQIRIVNNLIRKMGRDNTLEPLSDDSSLDELSAFLNVSKDTVRRHIKILFDKGVYGKFEAAKVNQGYSKHWMLNPYISASSKMVSDTITNLFRGTEPELFCRYKQMIKNS